MEVLDLITNEINTKNRPSDLDTAFRKYQIIRPYVLNICSFSTWEGLYSSEELCDLRSKFGQSLISLFLALKNKEKNDSFLDCVVKDLSELDSLIDLYNFLLRTKSIESFSLFLRLLIQYPNEHSKVRYEDWLRYSDALMDIYRYADNPRDFLYETSELFFSLVPPNDIDSFKWQMVRYVFRTYFDTHDTLVKDYILLERICDVIEECPGTLKLPYQCNKLMEYILLDKRPHSYLKEKAMTMISIIESSQMLKEQKYSFHSLVNDWNSYSKSSYISVFMNNLLTIPGLFEKLGPLLEKKTVLYFVNSSQVHSTSLMTVIAQTHKELYADILIERKETLCKYILELEKKKFIVSKASWQYLFSLCKLFDKSDILKMTTSKLLSRYLLWTTDGNMVPFSLQTLCIRKCITSTYLLRQHLKEDVNPSEIDEIICYSIPLRTIVFNITILLTTLLGNGSSIANMDDLLEP